MKDNSKETSFETMQMNKLFLLYLFLNLGEILNLSDSLIYG